MKTDVVNPHSNISLHFLSAILAFIIYILLFALLIGAFIYTHKVYSRQGSEVQSELNVDDFSGIELAEVVEHEVAKDTQEEIVEKEVVEKIEELEASAPKIEPIKSKEIAKPQETLKPKDEPMPKEDSKKEDSKQEPNLADMFSSISSQTIQDKKAKELEEQKRLREEELARINEERRKQAEILAQNAAAIKQSTQALQQATKDLQNNVKEAMQTKINIEKPKFAGNPDDREKYDKWYDTIQAILMAEWRKNKFFYQTSTGTTVRIKVDSGGKLTYLYTTRPSPYAEYNAAVISFLHSMEKKLFPPPPSSDIEFNININSTLRY